MDRLRPGAGRRVRHREGACLRRCAAVVALLAIGSLAGHSFAGDPSPETRERQLGTGLRAAIDAYQSAGSPKALGEREAAIAKISAALSAVSTAGTEGLFAHRGGPERQELAKAIAQACRIEIPTLLPAAWRAAAWIEHPATAAALQSSGERMPLFVKSTQHEYFEVIRTVPTVGSRRAFVRSVQQVWNAGARLDDSSRQDFRAALARSALVLSEDHPDSTAAASTGLVSDFEAALKTTDEALFLDLAVALAGSPCAAARAPLDRAIRARRSTREETIASILKALGQAGDEDAVPLLLAHVPGTPAPVFEAAYFGLWQCKPDGLAPNAKAALRLLIPLLDEEGRAANAMSGASTPKAARTRERMAVVARLAPSMVPESKEGNGWWALLWKIVDAAGDTLERAGPPPERKGWTHVNGRVTPLSTEAWVEWWKRAR